MCTVSFVPTSNKIIFTFNRDEQPERLTPEYLNEINVGHKLIYFTKDIKAGGSWFTCDDFGNVALLFNGALSPHTKLPSYNRSRGLILLEIISAKELLQEFNNIDLLGIEPFSIILLEDKKLYRLVWDGINKTVMALNEKEYQIFSSSTLYSIETQCLRKLWLNDYLKKTDIPTPDLMYKFHTGNHISDTENGLIIKRDYSTHTLSISQIEIIPSNIYLRHWDLKTEEYYQQMIQLK